MRRLNWEFVKVYFLKTSYQAHFQKYLKKVSFNLGMFIRTREKHIWKSYKFVFALNKKLSKTLEDQFDLRQCCNWSMNDQFQLSCEYDIEFWKICKEISQYWKNDFLKSEEKFNFCSFYCNQFSFEKFFLVNFSNLLRVVGFLVEASR